MKQRVREMRAVAYLRVSTDDQAESGLGLEAQAADCRRWADGEKRGLVGPFSDDGVSGAASLDKRPGLGDAIAALGDGDVLLVAKRDRLGRDPIVVAMIEAAVGRKGCRVVSAAGEGTDNDDPTNVLMRRIVDAFAEYERLIIKARTRAALGAKKRRGERMGQVPFGFRRTADGRGIEGDPSEQDLIRAMRRMRAGGLTVRAIAAELDRRRVPPKNGKGRWHHSSVAVILNRPLTAAG